MQVPQIRKIWKIRMFITTFMLLLAWSAFAQQSDIERETAIHENIKLIALAPSDDLEQEIQKDYRTFLPILEEALKENTSDESDACALTLRVTPGMREVGSKKTQRAQVQVSAIRKNSRQEFIATFILYSYVNEGLVDKEETTQFLKKQVLNVAECAE
ncbi:MAG: hypothetical protein LBP68_05815 [Acidobacteriota bacterium]|jgi:hypothetical protein|nr:hypothetical protein [Acidobacteriota bacterium]